MKRISALSILLLALAVSACADSVELPLDSDPSITEAEQGVVPARRGRANLVQVTARGLSFEAPEAIPSGWTTFRFENETGMTHFAVVERLPEGIGVEDQQAEVAPVFQAGMDLLNAGDFDAALAAFGSLPAWFFEIVFMGGPGLVGPRGTAQTTMYLEPGTYLIECYVKSDGIFHSYNPFGGTGMVAEIQVTDDPSLAPPIESTIEVAVSSSTGIVVQGDLRPGSHTVAVHFDDQIVHEHFLGHDVHLVRLREDTDLDALATWMDWTQPTGLETPAPAEFLGGVQASATTSVL